MIQSNIHDNTYQCDVTILPNLTLQTDIWLVVSVPVLSEQITDVQPSVSTDGRLRTMAFFLAILLVPSARQVVMTAGRPGRKHHRIIIVMRQLLQEKDGF